MREFASRRTGATPVSARRKAGSPDIPLPLMSKPRVSSAPSAGRGRIRFHASPGGSGIHAGAAEEREGRREPRPGIQLAAAAPVAPALRWVESRTVEHRAALN